MTDDDTEIYVGVDVEGVRPADHLDRDHDAAAEYIERKLRSVMNADAFDHFAVNVEVEPMTVRDGNDADGDDADGETAE